MNISNATTGPNAGVDADERTKRKAVPCSERTLRQMAEDCGLDLNRIDDQQEAMDLEDGKRMYLDE